MARNSIQKRPNGKFRARYRDAAGKEHARHFDLKRDAERWLNEVTTSQVTGQYVDPRYRNLTFGQWSDTWLTGYGTRRSSTVRQARVHLSKIREEFENVPLAEVRPSAIRSWLARLVSEGFEQSYVYALHSRLSQVMADAVLDGRLAQNPCSRRTSPTAGSQRAYVATTRQVWALHQAMPEHSRIAILLGAFAGLRISECCGLRVSDVGFLTREITPTVQYPNDELKTEMSRTAVPVAGTLLSQITRQLQRWPGEWVLTTEQGRQCGPWRIERDLRRARKQVEDLPEGFRHQDLRHYFASLLISSGMDVKVVQHRLRHASAKTTLDTYGHLWPDTEESTRSATETVLTGLINAPADCVRTRES